MRKLRIQFVPDKLLGAELQIVHLPTRKRLASSGQAVDQHLASNFKPVLHVDRIYGAVARSLGLDLEDRSPTATVPDRAVGRTFSIVKDEAAVLREVRQLKLLSAQSVFTSRMCSTVLHFASRRRGPPKTSASPLARDTATWMRFNENKNSMPLGVS